MPNTLTLTTPIPVPNIRSVKLQAVTFDEDSKVATIEMLVMAAGGVFHPQAPFIMVVRNGKIEGALVANPTPATITDVIVQATMTGVGTSFDGALAAYTGIDRRGALLTFLKGVVGTVTASGQPSIIGSSQPALPAGTVS